MAQPFLDLNLIETRIRVVVTTIAKVGEAVDLAAARNDLRSLAAAAYVMPLRDAPGRNTLANAVDQDVTVSFGILLAAKSLKDVRGEHAQDLLRGYRSSVADALLNWTPGTYDDEEETWTPDPNYSPCEYAGGRLMMLDNDGVLWWLDEYRTRYYVRKTD